MTDKDDVLKHFGVKGMKWGVRKATTRGSTPPSKRPPKSESLGMHSMSDAELRNAINRIKLQQEYARLTAPPPKEKSRSRQLVENIVFSSAEAAGKKVLTGVLTNAMESVLPPVLRGAPKKSKTDEVAEKVIKGLKGDQKKGGGDESSPKKSSGDDEPKKPSGGGDQKKSSGNQRGKSSFGSPNIDPPQVDENGFVKPSRQYTPRRSRSSSGGFKSPFGRRKKESSSGSYRQEPPVTVPPATVFSRDRKPSSSPAAPAGLPRVPRYSQGRPGSSGKGREYDNDETTPSSRSSSYRQGRPGNTEPLRKKRRKWFGHDGVTEDDILALIHESDDTLAHYGVKGMHWGSRKPTYRKFSPQGVSEGRRPKMVVKRRGIAGHIPIVGRKRKLSRRKTQRLIDELDLNFRIKDVKRSEKPAVLSTVGDKARIKYYQDKTARKKR